MHIDTNQFKDLSFDTRCKVQLSDENKILMDKSLFERYRKYKCCVFIDFEYILSKHMIIVIFHFWVKNVVFEQTQFHL